MNDGPSHNLDGLDIDLARRVDAICRLFEADWRAGVRRSLDGYVAEVPDQARAALRAELEALERELGRSDETVASSGLGSSAEPAGAPAEPATSPIAGQARLSVYEDATVPPSDEATLAHGPSSPAKTAEQQHSLIRYFGDYEIVREIARGGMGVVFQARQMSLNRLVALKMILAGQLANEADILRFRLEAEAAGNLDHPGIVPIFEVGEHEGQHYFSMGFVEGQSLSQRLADGPLPSRQAAGLILKVAEAIEYAHRLGVVHRDLKPGNILLDRAGNPRVTDFGLAKKVQGDSGLTASGQIMGTPSYMAPEQAGGKQGEVGPAADVYALGSTLYCVVTGRPPFQAANAMDTVIQVVSDDPVPPRRLNPAVDRDLETICLKCLEKEPAKRYASAAALGDDLRRYLGGEPILARPVTPLERAVKWARRRPGIAGLAAALVVALVAGFTGMALLWARAVSSASIAHQKELQAEESARTEAEARGEAQTQAMIATEKAEALRRQDYISRVNLAYRECLDNNVARAIELLGGCPEDLRGWEWHYVSRQCHLELHSFRDSAPCVNAVAFSPDGLRIASGSGSFMYGGAGDLVVRDVTTGGEIYAYRGLSGGVRAVAFSPDGRLLAAGQGSTLVLYDAATGRERYKKSTGSNGVDGLAFTPDSQRIITGCGGSPGYSKIWDVPTGNQLGDALPGYGGDLAYVAISPDGQQAAVGSTGRVDVWDLQTLKSVRTLKGHESFVYAVAFSPDGRYLASGGFDRTIRLWDRATGDEVRRFLGHEGFVRGVAFSPDSKHIVSCAEDKSIKLWSVASDRELATFHGHQHYVMCIAFSPDGHLIASGSVDQTTKLWFATPTPQLTFKGHTGWVNSVAFSPDGHQIASSAGLRTIYGPLRVWDPVTGEQIRAFADERASIGAVAFSPEGRKLAASVWDGTVKVWDVASESLQLFLRGNAKSLYEPTNIAFSPDGRHLALADDDGSVKIWDASSGRALQTLKGHTADANSVAFSPDGRQMASADGEGTVKIWDTATWRALQTLKGHTLRVASVAFSPDGRLLASVGGISQKFGEVKVWDLATGRELYQVRGHTDTVSGVAFSPDGRRLTTASDDRAIKLWDAATGQEVFTLRGHSSGVVCVAFSPDGQRIASGSIDQTVKVWDTAQPSAEQLLQRLAAPVVAELFRTRMLKSDVIEEVRRDPKLDESLRAAALHLAERLKENPMLLNNTSWLIAREPGRTADDYSRALRYAEAACRLVPQESTFVNTVGVARYRAGQYRAALADLNRSLKLNSPRFGGPIPADLAFLAMARHKLGQSAEARKTLEQLRDAMSRKPWSDDDKSEAFSDEANSLIAGTQPPIVEASRLLGHDPGAEIQMLDVSRDGLRILSGSSDKTMILWDRTTGKIIRRFGGHVGSVRSVAFLPDGHRGLSADEAGKVVRLWDLESGQSIREFRGHLESIFSLTVSPNGRLAYSGGAGRTDFAVRVWDVETGQGVRRLEGHTGMVWSLAISPDGRRVFSGGGDGNAILWDATTGAEIRRFGGHSAGVQCVAFLPDGHRAVSSGFDRTIHLWDIESGRELHRFVGHPGEVTCVAVSPDGRRLLSSDYPGRELRLWDVEGRKLIRRIGWGGTAPTRGAFSPDGRHVVWGGTDGIVRMYRLSARDGAGQVREPGPPERPDLGAKPSTKK